VSDAHVHIDEDQYSSSSRLSMATGPQRSNNSKLVSGVKSLAAANRVSHRSEELWSPGSATRQKVTVEVHAPAVDRVRRWLTLDEDTVH